MLVLAGFDLADVQLEPHSLLGASGETLTDRLRSREANAPLILAPQTSSLLPTRGLVALSDVLFSFLGRDGFGIEDVLTALSQVITVGSHVTAEAAVLELLRLSASASSPTVMTYSVLPRGQRRRTRSPTRMLRRRVHAHGLRVGQLPGSAIVEGLLDLSVHGSLSGA